MGADLLPGWHLLRALAFCRHLKMPQRLFNRLPELFFLPGRRCFAFGFRRRKHPLRDLDQAVDMLIEGRAQRVEPMPAAEAQPQCAGRANVLDAERDDHRAGVKRRHDLVEDVGRGVRRRRKDLDDEFRRANCLDDRRAPVPKTDIARGNPTTDARCPSRWQTASAAALSTMV